MQDAIAMIFLFACGACIGSFLNVVVWRLPRGESLSHPPSHCPKCNTRLKWYDNLPVVGWLKLRGRCRHCGQPISPRYPIVEGATGAIFVFFYVMFFMTQTGPCADPQRLLSLQKDWPIFGLYLVALSGLLAASLIDIELFMIPLQIPYFLAIVGLAVHTLVDRTGLPGGLITSSLASALAIGGGAGLLVSVILLKLHLMPLSFPNGEVLEIDRELVQKDIDAAHERGDDPPEMPEELSRSQVRIEIGKEMLFLLPPMLGALLAAVTSRSDEMRTTWEHLLGHQPIAGFAGALLGALVGAFTVWIVRIIASLAFGRVAMGLGDVHLMFGVGAIIGAGGAVVTFMLAPFFGIGYGLYRWLSGRGHELPYGPFLGLACGLTLLFYCPIHEYFRPGLEGLVLILTGQMTF